MRARRTASARFEVAVQSAIKFLYSMAVWGLVDGRIGNGVSDEGFGGDK